MSRELNIVVVGATGVIGRKVISILEERNFPVRMLSLIASAKSVGKKIEFKGRDIFVEDINGFNFQGFDLAIFAAGSKIASDLAPIASAKGAVVIDSSSYFRMKDECKLIVPEVNGYLLSDVVMGDIISNPNCSTIQMVMALSPIHKKYGIKRVVVSTYQSVSGAGKLAMDTLKKTTGRLLEKGDAGDSGSFTKQIAFNSIPHIDKFMDDGSTKEEWKMVVETCKILGSEVPIHANCARIPSLYSHGEYVNLETEKNLSETDISDLLNSCAGVKVWDERENGGYATPFEVRGKDEVFISRIRKDHSVQNGISFWCVSDNLRKGGALNAVQIAELVIGKLR